MECDTSLWLRAPGPVLQVTPDRMTDRGHLRPYLVRTSGEQLDFQERVAVTTREEQIPEYRRVSLRVHARLVRPRIVFQPVGERRRQLVGHAGYHGPVSSLDLSGSYLAREFRRRRTRSRTEHETADRSIQSMDRIAAPADPGRENGQNRLIAGPVRLAWHARWLVDNRKVTVVVEELD